MKVSSSVSLSLLLVICVFYQAFLFLDLIPTLSSLLGNSLSRGRHRVNDLVLRFPRHTLKCREVLKGEAAECVWMQEAASVCLLFAYLYLKDVEESVVFSGTVARSDGIVATSADCLKHLKGTEHEVTFSRKTLYFQISC
ncbi:hypothetical protein RHGRI_002944 [Rhododendron griersonianum]|uniref:Uncharacterized protein n=1 Tax=Rhododendron griersonianum TaxID=479676 RepID=A0AAV6LS78_9ERIC|nr:hypothetical protein RHGRI_002944 [Rhododendron griersonianum]